MSDNLIRGRVLKFGDNINTDFINPAQYMELSMEEMIAHAMEGADPDFSEKVKAGDIMVAGKNFGSGSSRETAPAVIKGSGISVVIAEFFARIFFRNAINIGLKVLTCEQAYEINDGDELEVDPAKGRIRDLTTGKSYTCSSLPDHIMELVNDGGLINHLEKTLKGNTGSFPGADIVIQKGGEKMSKKVKARTICKGYGEGEAVVSPKAIGFNLGVDVEKGTIIESGHPLEGVCIKDKVLVFPNGKGSTGGSYVVYQLYKEGTGPAAMINLKTDTIVAAGAIMGGLPCVDNLDPADYDFIETGDWVKVDAANGIVEIIKKGGK